MESPQFSSNYSASSIHIVNEVTGSVSSTTNHTETRYTGIPGSSLPRPRRVVPRSSQLNHNDESRYYRLLRIVRNCSLLIAVRLLGFLLRAKRNPKIIWDLFANLFKQFIEIKAEFMALQYFVLRMIFNQSNSKLMEEVSRGEFRSRKTLLFVALPLALLLYIMYFWLDSEESYYALIFMCAHDNCDYLHILLTNIVFTDHMVRLLTVCVKVCVVMLPESILDFGNRGKIYHFIECSSQLYRSFLPVRPWFIYCTSISNWLLNVRIVGYIFATIYVIRKLKIDSKERVHLVWEAYQMLLSSNVNLPAITVKGATKLETGADADNATEGKNENDKKEEVCCAICYGDKFVDPLKLQCGHVFCENCIITWATYKRMEEKNGTCPLCQAKVVIHDKLIFRDGSTAKLNIIA